MTAILAVSIIMLAIPVRAAQLNQKSRAKVVCFGDSITKRGYYEVLGHLLSVEAINAGVGGNSTSQALRRMTTDVLEAKPYVVVIFFGTNDMRVDSPRVHVPVDKYTANLEEMVASCRAQGAKVVLCTLPPIVAEAYFTRHRREVFDAAGGLTKLIAMYRNAAMQVAAAQKLPLVDLNKLLEKEPDWLTKDGVHPSKQGCAVIAKYIAKVVGPLLPKEKLSSVITNGMDHEADILIYGATSAGITAAVQAARMNKSVVLLESSDHVGGLTSGGLGATDIGNKNVIGGLSREFYHRVALHYQQDEAWIHETRKEFFDNRSKRTKLSEVSGEDATMWTFEPHVADAIFEQFLEEAGVEVRQLQKLTQVEKVGPRITQIATSTGDRYQAKMFIDASYEGDLMARAGVSYRVGRESNLEYDETLNGIRPETPKNQITGSIDPYVAPGDASSGLIPLIASGDGGTPGEGDHRVQAYNFRLCFTDVAANRLPLTPPSNYDPGLYELAARRVEKIVEKGVEPRLNQFCNPVWMPNRKTDINNSQGISTDFIGENYEYPDADYESRAEIWQAHENYVCGFWYFMSTSPRIPDSLRRQFLAFGPCRDEFQETSGWPSQLYVREARRMRSDYVMTEHNCRSKEVANDSIGMAAYGMDSHNCQRIVKNGIARNEGDVQQHGFRPYPISYRSIVPKASECENLLVPVCVSATHIAFGSIRMEPVFMVLGQSSALAASLSIDEGSSVQAVEYRKLQGLLWASQQVLSLPAKIGNQ